MKKMMLTLIFSAFMTLQVFCQVYNQTNKSQVQESVKKNKYTIHTTYLSLLNFGEEKTNTHHYELQLGYRLTPQDKIGIKLATWKLFAPMGMPMEEQLKFDESNYYPGRLRESGIGFTYQRKLWKELFVTAEILPQLKTYLDTENNKICDGFKLYTSYHLGYHFSLFKDRFYLEPQVHCQYWPIDTDVPAAFKAKDDQWNNYFLFEPDLYLGVNFEY